LQNCNSLTTTSGLTTNEEKGGKAQKARKFKIFFHCLTSSLLVHQNTS
jgi:hypothetical protein